MTGVDEADGLPGQLTFRRLREDDLPLLARWLRDPEVERWWHHEHTDEDVARDFGPAVRGEEPGEDLVVLLGGRPVGLVQRSPLAAYPDELERFAGVLDVPDGAVELDYLLGTPDVRRRGLGPRVIRTVVEGTWEEHPQASCVLVAVVAANRASWRALEKAGLRRVADAELTPDNPVDDPLHHLYRADRPGFVSGP